MITELKEIFIHPDIFFKNLSQEPEIFSYPLIIVGCGAVLGGISSYFMTGILFNYLGNASNGSEFSFGTVSQIWIVVQTIPWYFIKWGLIAGLFFLISGYYSKEGTFNRALINTGYGMIPLVIQNALMIPVIAYYRPDLENAFLSAREVFRTGLSQNAGAVIPGMSGQLQQFMNTLNNNPAFQEFSRISLVLTSIFTLLSAYLWIFGIKNTRQITLKQASIVVMLPVAVYLLIIVFTDWFLFNM